MENGKIDFFIFLLYDLILQVLTLDTTKVIIVTVLTLVRIGTLVLVVTVVNAVTYFEEEK